MNVEKNDQMGISIANSVPFSGSELELTLTCMFGDDFTGDLPSAKCYTRSLKLGLIFQELDDGVWVSFPNRSV